MVLTLPKASALGETVSKSSSKKGRDHIAFNGLACSCFVASVHSHSHKIQRGEA